jgi:hypothetical protein
LLGLFVLLVACVALIGGDQDTAPKDDKAEKAEQGGPTPAKKEEKKKETKKQQQKGREQAVAVGQPVDVGEVQWTVTNAYRTNELSQEGFGQFGKTKTGDFVVVDLRFRNNGNEPARLTSNSVTLLDANGRESQPDTDTFGYIPQEKNILLEQVNPGVTRDARVIFSVAPDASDFTLELGDANLFSNENGYVDLGF